MEPAEPVQTSKPILSDLTLNGSLESKEYELKLDNDIYLLKMELHSNNLISLSVRQTNNLSLYYYYKEFKYESLTNLLLLNYEYYDNI